MHSQHLLQIVDADFLVEFLRNRHRIAAHPDLELGIQIEGAGSFDAEFCDLAIGHREVIDLAAGEPLDIHQDQALVGKYEGIAQHHESHFKTLALNQEAAIVRRELVRRYDACIPQ